jgi:hypothetical protein
MNIEPVRGTIIEEPPVDVFFTVTTSESNTLTASDTLMEMVLEDAPARMLDPSNVTVGLGRCGSEDCGFVGGIAVGVNKR